MMLGRFGWKANVATMRTRRAVPSCDMGITSRHFANEACTLAEEIAWPHPAERAQQRKASPA